MSSINFTLQAIVLAHPEFSLVESLNMRASGIILGCLLLATLGELTAACQEQWILARANSDGDVIGFRNVTKIGKHQTLAWNWHGEKGSHWTSRIWQSLEDDKIIGGFKYRKNERHSRKTASLSWKINNNSLTWMSEGDVDSSELGWKILICHLNIDYQFVPLTNDTWSFILGNVTINGGQDGSLQSLFTTKMNEGETIIREKRSNDKEYPTNIPSIEVQMANYNSTIPRTIFHAIIDFFFGEDFDRSDGGIFTRISKWIEKMACSLRGTCDKTKNTSTTLRPFTRPTQEPDAEILNNGNIV